MDAVFAPAAPEVFVVQKVMGVIMLIVALVCLCVLLSSLFSELRYMAAWQRVRERVRSLSEEDAIALAVACYRHCGKSLDWSTVTYGGKEGKSILGENPCMRQILAAAAAEEAESKVEATGDDGG